MISKAELASKRRQTALLLMASAFPIWQIPLTDYFSSTESQFTMISALSTLGMLIWTAGLLWFIALSRSIVQAADSATLAELDDELVRLNRQKAFAIGYFSASACAALLFMINFIVPVSGQDVARLMLVVCVVFPTIAFVKFERLNG